MIRVEADAGSQPGAKKKAPDTRLASIAMPTDPKQRDNEERYRLLESTWQPERSERDRPLRKKRRKLARALEHLRTPGLSPGIARELRKHVAELEREIAELMERERQ